MIVQGLQRVTPKPVVCAQLDDDDAGLIFLQQQGQTSKPPGGRFPTDAGIDYLDFSGLVL